MRVLRRQVARTSIVAALLCLSVAIVAPAAIVHAAPVGASAYVPVSPYRVLDTRIGQGFPRRVNAGETFSLTLPGVPAGASAVVLNLVVDGSAAPGFVTVYPTGVNRPLASSINVDSAGLTIANLVTVPIGTGGTVDLYSLMTTDLVADVQGYYMPATTATTGLFRPMGPIRLLDTRNPNSIHVGALASGEQIDVNVGALAGLPGDATAAALKITVTESAASGFWTVYPADTNRPTASNINVFGAGSTIANQVIAQLTSGRITVFSQSGGQLIIDLVGWFTGPSTPPSDVGLFVPVTPARLLDSRELPLGARPGHNRTAQIPVAGRFGLPASGIGAVVVNATATDTAGIGFFTVWPAQTYRPTTSSLNATHIGQTIADHVITPVSAAGFSFYTQTGSHLVVDIAGWYTGTEIPTVLPPSVPLTGVGGPPPTPPFTFSNLLNGAPTRWNPCAPIHYLVNMGGYSDNFRPVIAEAVERLEAATGLLLIPIGDTTYMPTSTNQSQLTSLGGELVIALGDELQTDQVPGSILGRAFILYLTSILRASVVIDVGTLGSNPPWSSLGVGPVLLHELGHAVGLNHVTDASQLMNQVASSNGPTTYGAGDLTGLWQVGAAAGCTT